MINQEALKLWNSGYFKQANSPEEMVVMAMAKGSGMTESDVREMALKLWNDGFFTDAVNDEEIVSMAYSKGLLMKDDVEDEGDIGESTKVKEDKVEKVNTDQKPTKEGELKLNNQSPKKDGKEKTDVKVSDAPVKQSGSPDDKDLNKGKDGDPSLGKDNIEKAKGPGAEVKQGDSSIDKDKNKAKDGDPVLSKDNIEKPPVITKETAPKGQQTADPNLGKEGMTKESVVRESQMKREILELVDAAKKTIQRAIMLGKKLSGDDRETLNAIANAIKELAGMKNESVNEGKFVVVLIGSSGDVALMHDIDGDEAAGVAMFNSAEEAKKAKDADKDLATYKYKVVQIGESKVTKESVKESKLGTEIVLAAIEGAPEGAVKKAIDYLQDYAKTVGNKVTSTSTNSITMEIAPGELKQVKNEIDKIAGAQKVYIAQVKESVDAARKRNLKEAKTRIEFVLTNEGHEFYGEHIDIAKKAEYESKAGQVEEALNNLFPEGTWGHEFKEPIEYNKQSPRESVKMAHKVLEGIGLSPDKGPAKGATPTERIAYLVKSLKAEKDATAMQDAEDMENVMALIAAGKNEEAEEAVHDMDTSVRDTFIDHFHNFGTDKEALNAIRQVLTGWEIGEAKSDKGEAAKEDEKQGKEMKKEADKPIKVVKADGTSEGKVADPTSDNMDGIIKDLLEKEGLVEGKVADPTSDNMEKIMQDLLESKKKVNEADLKMDAVQASVASGLIQWALKQPKVQADSKKQDAMVDWVKAGMDILQNGLYQAAQDAKGYTISGDLMGPAIGLIGWAIKQPEIKNQSKDGVMNVAAIGNEIINPPQKGREPEPPKATPPAPEAEPAPAVKTAVDAIQKAEEKPAEVEAGEELEKETVNMESRNVPPIKEKDISDKIRLENTRLTESTHVSAFIDGVNVHLYVDDMSDLFVSTPIEQLAQAAQKAEEERPGRDWTDGTLVIDTKAKTLVGDKQGGLWYDWPEIQKKLAKMREEGWKINVPRMEDEDESIKKTEEEKRVIRESAEEVTAPAIRLNNVAEKHVSEGDKLHTLARSLETVAVAEEPVKEAAKEETEDAEAEAIIRRTLKR